MDTLPTLPDTVDAGLPFPDRFGRLVAPRAPLRVRVMRGVESLAWLLWQGVLALGWLLECLWSLSAIVGTLGGIIGSALGFALLAVLVWGGLIWSAWQVVGWLLS